MAGSPEFLNSIVSGLKRALIRRLIGAAIGVVLLGGFAAFKFIGGHGDAQQPTASVAAAGPAVRHTAPTPAHPQGQDVPVAANAAASPTTVTATPVAAGKGTQVVNAQPASSTGASAPVVTAVPQNAPANASQAHLDDHLTYQYNALGRRDPFQSLVDGQFVGADVGGDAPPDPGGIKVVGIVWGANDQFALVEDVRGNSFVLRKGDKVQNGVVEGLKRDGVIVNITADGQSQSVVIPLVRKGDQNAR